MVVKRIDPQKFRQLAGGTLSQRSEALRQLIDAGLAVMEPVMDLHDEHVVRFLNHEHPCVAIYRGTRSRQGVRA